MADLQLGSVNTVSSGEFVIWVDAEILEKLLLSLKEQKNGGWEMNTQAFLVLAFAEDGFVTGDTKFSMAAMNGRNLTG